MSYKNMSKLTVERDEFEEYRFRSLSCGLLEIPSGQWMEAAQLSYTNALANSDDISDDDNTGSTRGPSLLTPSYQPRASPRTRGSRGRKLNRHRPSSLKNNRSSNSDTSQNGNPVQRSHSARRPQPPRPLDFQNDATDNISADADDDTADEPCKIVRVRSFKSSSRGLINRGDALITKDNGSNSSIHSSESCPERLVDKGKSGKASAKASAKGLITKVLAKKIIQPCTYRVVVLGAAGAGKSSLIHQFQTSEYMGDETPCLGKQTNY